MFVVTLGITILEATIIDDMFTSSRFLFIVALRIMHFGVGTTMLAAPNIKLRCHQAEELTVATFMLWYGLMRCAIGHIQMRLLAGIKHGIKHEASNRGDTDAPYLRVDLRSIFRQARPKLRTSLNYWRLCRCCL